MKSYNIWRMISKFLFRMLARKDWKQTNQMNNFDNYFPEKKQGFANLNYSEKANILSKSFKAKKSKKEKHSLIQ